ncbi:MAG: FAD-dependent oxidoreductase [Clostridia bacterium]
MENKFYDVVIIGGGSAGLASAIYLSRAKCKCLVIEKTMLGGQIIVTSEVVNYPGVFNTSGVDLIMEMQRQAENFGAEFAYNDVLDFKKEDERFIVTTDEGEIECKGIIIATGATPRIIGFKGEEEYKGRGISYCATCDGEFFTGKEIYVIGGGIAACEEALYLTRFATKVHLIVRRDVLRCTGHIADEVQSHQAVQIHYNSNIKEVSGKRFVDNAVFSENGEEFTVTDETGLGIFIFAGYVPSSEIFEGKINLSEDKYIITDKRQKTNIDGVYAAGDVCVKDLRQVVTAVSDGATAATALEKYLSEK